jgi:hypothetical protein
MAERQNKVTTFLRLAKQAGATASIKGQIRGIIEKVW